MRRAPVIDKPRRAAAPTQLRAVLRPLTCVAALSIAARHGQAQATSGWPVAEFGAKLLERAKALDAAAAQSSDLRTRLAPLHERVRIGAFELWLPRETLDANGRWADCKLAREASKYVDALAKLQVRWVARLASEGGNAPPVQAQEFAKWASSWKPGKRPANERETALHDYLFEQIRGAPTAAGDFGHIVCIAPTRPQLCALAGAHVALKPSALSWIDAPWLSLCREFFLPDGVLVIGLASCASGADPKAFIDEPLPPLTVLENLTHNASHAITNARHTGAPRWWREGLAVDDTLSVAGSDETLCSGASDASLGGELGAAIQWMSMLSRYKSPFRGPGAAKGFIDALRHSRRERGFELIDLDTNRPAFSVQGPWLGDPERTPELVGSAPPGVRKCYAELRRAYDTAFVRFLDADGAPQRPSTLQSLSREYAKRLDAKQRRISLHKLSLEVTSRSLGASSDPERDHEAAFDAFLAR